jgi:hypothetical protein
LLIPVNDFSGVAVHFEPSNPSKFWREDYEEVKSISEDRELLSNFKMVDQDNSVVWIGKHYEENTENISEVKNKLSLHFYK